MNRLLRVFGIVLLLGGLAHTAGVLHFYFTTGVPEANRVLLDIWIAEAQLLGGALYVMAGRGSGGGRSSRIVAVFGALIIIGFAVPMLPVLFSRAPILFRIPAMVYLIASIFVLATLVKTERSEEG